MTLEDGGVLFLVTVQLFDLKLKNRLNFIIMIILISSYYI